MRLRAKPLLILASVWTTSMAMTQPFLGLSLGPRFITVAQSFPNNTAKVIAQVEGIETYQKTFAAMARKQSLDQMAFNLALQKSLKLVQAATNTHFNRRVEIPVVSLPSVICDHSVMPTIMDAVTSISFASHHYDLQLQTTEMSFAAHYAYELGSAKGLGLEEMDVDWDMGSYEALLLDYNSVSLSLSLIDLAQHGCVIRRQVEYPELGGDSSVSEDASMKDNNLEKPIRADSQVASYYSSIQQSLKEFLERELLLSDNDSNTGSAWKPLRSDIRAIILAGDSSPQGFDDLRAILREIFSTQPAPGWLKDEIEPKNMAAVGVAKRAMHLLGKPEDFDVHVQYIAHDHDEL